MFETKKTIFLGESFEKSCEIKAILEQNNIKYKETIISHDEAYIGGDRGVARSVSGMNSRRGKLFELKVNAKDFELAEYVIHGKD